MAIKFGNQPFSVLGTKRVGDNYISDPQEISGKYWALLEFNGDKKTKSDKRYFTNEHFELQFSNAVFVEGWLLAATTPNSLTTTFEFQNSSTELVDKWVQDGCLIAVKVDGNKQLETIYRLLPNKDTVLFSSITLFSTPKPLPTELEQVFVEDIEGQLANNGYVAGDEVDLLIDLGYCIVPLIDPNSQLAPSKNNARRGKYSFVEILTVKDSFKAPDKKGSGGSNGGGGKSGYYSPEQRNEFVLGELRKCGFTGSNALEVVKFATQSQLHWTAFNYILNVSGSYTPNFTQVLEVEQNIVIPITPPSETNGKKSTEDKKEEEKVKEESTQDLINLKQAVQNAINTFPTTGQFPPKYDVNAHLVAEVEKEDRVEWCTTFLQVLDTIDIADKAFKMGLKNKGVRKASLALCDLDELKIALDQAREYKASL